MLRSSFDKFLVNKTVAYKRIVEYVFLWYLMLERLNRKKHRSLKVIKTFLFLILAIALQLYKLS